MFEYVVWMMFLIYNDNELNEMLKEDSLPVISPKTKSSNEPSFIKWE